MSRTCMPYCSEWIRPRGLTCHWRGEPGLRTQVNPRFGQNPICVANVLDAINDVLGSAVDMSKTHKLTCAWDCWPVYLHPVAEVFAD